MPRVVSISHSYVVALNRRLVRELALAAGGGWEFEAIGPRFFHGDLRSLSMEPTRPDDGFLLHPVSVGLSRRIHFFVYGPGLRGLLRRNYDLVHAWEEPYVLAGAQIAALTPRESALVFSTFQNISKTYPTPFAQLERYAVRRASALIAWGNTVAETIAPRLGYEGKRIRTITPGVDIEAFRPDPKRGRHVREKLEWDDTETLTIGFVGRFVEEKGIRLLIRVLDRLTGPWRALFVGSGPLEALLRAWASRRPGQVRVVVGVPHDDVPSYLNAMDVLCAPSQTTPTWREQFGRMLIEAFASGVAVVASDSGEIPRTVGAAGIILPEDDEARWASTLDHLIGDRSSLGALAEAGLARAHATFAWPVVALAHLNFFSEVLDMQKRIGAGS